MKHKLPIILGLAAATLLGLGLAGAQQRPEVASAPPTDVSFALQQGPGGERLDAGVGEPIELLGLQGMHSGKVVTGAPYSATAISETVQTLSDGNQITRKTQTLLFRDSQGRFRKETAVQGFGPWAFGQPKTFVIVHDPVVGKAYTLDTTNKVARELPNLTQKFVGDETHERIKRQFQKLGKNGADNIQTEDLGKQTIAGVVAQGTRRTHTIAAGEIGNQRPITIVSETWYSPDLQVVVKKTHSDPRFGSTTYTLSNIQQKEPDASLFSVPADFTVTQGGGHGFGGMRRRGPAPPAATPEN
jgi:hypothetical protein